MKEKYRALFVNAGILGHTSVFTLLREAVETVPDIESVHINLNDKLTVDEKIVRRLLCFQTFGRGRLGELNLDLARWRQEINCGLQAARRISACERGSGPFDVLHFHTQATAYLSLRRMKKTPSIVSIDCTQEQASMEKSSKLARRTYRPNIIHDGAVFRAASVIVSISEWAAQGLKQSYPDCAEKVRVMPYPVKLESFKEDWLEERHERARAKDARVRLLFMGGDFNRKGGPELLSAWRQGGFEKSAELDLVTDWPISPQDLPAGVRLVKNIRPFTTAWSDLWRRAEVFVMPTRSEAFGMVYQEAAAAGVPVIGTRINALPEIIEDGVTGLLVARGDERELVAAMKTLIESAQLRRRMGEAARRRCETLYSPESYSEKLTSIIRRLARGSESVNESQSAYVNSTASRSS